MRGKRRPAVPVRPILTAVNVGDRLQSLVDAADALAMGEYLKQLDGDELVEAQRWYRTAGAAVRSKPSVEDRQIRQVDPFGSMAPGRWRGLVWSSALCSAALAPAASAASWIPWRNLFGRPHAPEPAILVDLVSGRGADWAAVFAPRAADTKLSGTELRNESWLVHRVVTELTTCWSLPVPSGQTFLYGWVDTFTGDDLVGQLRADPLMPDVFLHCLNTNQVGRFGTRVWDRLDLAGAIQALVKEGCLDRGDVIERSLSSLSHPRTVATQRVISRILTALSLSAHDASCTFARLLGLISSAHGSVASMALPLAIEQVATADELEELVSAIGLRSERGIRATTVTALTSSAIADRVGDDAVSRSAAILLEHESDAARATQLQALVNSRTVAERQDVQTDSTPDPSPEGLWEAHPATSPAVERYPSDRSVTKDELRALKRRLPEYHWPEGWARPGRSPAAFARDLAFIVRLAHAQPEYAAKVVPWLDHEVINVTGGPLTLPLRDLNAGTLNSRCI